MSQDTPPTIYKAKDFGVFIGMVTTPIDKGRSFWEDELNTFFKEYKKEVSNICINLDDEDRVKEKEFKKHLYKPIPYYLFGNFDIGMLCLVEDFTLSSRRFRPYSHLLSRNKKIQDKGEDFQPSNFIYKTINGAVPDLSYLEEKQEESLADYHKELVQYSKEKPLIAIVNLKLNNALLIGSGSYLINLVLRKLEQHLNKGKNKVGYKLLLSWSWNEVTVLLFSDNFKAISDTILKIRSFNFKDLQGFCTPSYEYVLEKSLFKNKASKEHNIEETHLFVNTHSTYGFNLDFYFEPDKIKKKFYQENLDFFVRWYAKPGHLSEVKDVVEAELEGNEKGKLVVGKGDFGYSFNGTLKEFIQHLHNTIGDGNRKIRDLNIPFCNHVKKLYTIPVIAAEVPESKITDKHFYFNNKLSDYAFDLTIITDLVSDLKKIRVSKTVREKVTNMFVVFNDGIQDPVQYGYFIEIRPFLEWVLNWLEEMIQSSTLTVHEIIKELDYFTNNFILAYYNRFGQTHIINEISDYNISFNGGIQQLLTAYDSIYKILANHFGDDTYTSFANVTGESEIRSNFFRVRLNYFHLFQPEVFAVVAVHEAVNFFFHRNNIPELETLRRRKVHFEKTKKEGDNNPVDIIRRLPQALGEYSMMDFMTFKSGFNDSHDDLFEIWYWNHFFQSASNYGQFSEGRIAREKVNESSFNNRWFRFEFLAMLDDSGEFNTSYIKGLKILNEVKTAKKTNVIKDIIKAIDKHPKNKSIRKLLEKLKEIATYKIIDDFLNPKNWQNEEEKNKYLFEYLKNKHPITYTKHTNAIEKIIAGEKTITKSMQLALSKTIKTIYSDRVAAMNILKNASLEKFKAGEIVTIEYLVSLLPNTELTLPFVVQSILLAYLGIINEELVNSKKINVLERDQNGEIGNNEGKYTMDPFGGVLTLNYAGRRKHLMYRVLFIRTLWNIGNIFKKSLFKL